MASLRAGSRVATWNRGCVPGRAASKSATFVFAAPFSSPARAGAFEKSLHAVFSSACISMPTVSSHFSNRGSDFVFLLLDIFASAFFLFASSFKCFRSGMACSEVAARGVVDRYRRDWSHFATKHARGVLCTLRTAVTADSRGAVRAALKLMFVSRNRTRCRNPKVKDDHKVADHADELMVCATHIVTRQDSVIKMI